MLIDSSGDIKQINCGFIFPDGSFYGTLKDVLETGANDVYIVDKEAGGEILLPAIHECILDVSPEENRMTVHLMKGLE